jgi:arylsulfatase A-like enzyme
MDHNVGRILDRLEEQGMREDTLVFFTSDNGMNMGHHGIWGKGNGTFPLNMYDTSVKVPFILSWPGHLPQAVVDTHLLSHYDLLPTLLDYAGIPNREENLPGRSFAPLLRGEPFDQPEHVVVYDEYGPVRMIRGREWKYVHRYPYGPHELYDLLNDPGETNNLIDDPDRRPVAKALNHELDAWFQRYVDPRIDGAREAVTGKGQLDRAGVLGGEGKAFGDNWHYVDADGNRRQ